MYDKIHYKTNKQKQIPYIYIFNFCDQFFEQLTGSELGKKYIRIGKKVCILLPFLFNLYAEYILRNARLDDSEAGIKITGRNNNNHR